jgi:hypothetical protein
MTSKQIQKSMSELIVFSNTYEKLTGFTVDLKYLQQARVRAFYNDEGEIIGGYAISMVEYYPTLRYLSFLGNKQSIVLEKAGIKAEELIEITYTFFNKNRADAKQRIQILSYSILEALIKGKKYILGGGIIKQFNDRMRPVLPKVLFEGEVNVYGKQENFTVLYAQTNYILFNFLVALYHEIIKYFFKKSKLRNRR